MTLVMKLISLKIPEGQLKKVDALVKAGFYPSRSEAIRTAVRDLIQKET